ncbi:uncharacterized protein LOC105020867 [Esox lucius]|uniref:uncharacterized protein LOC105020867 n=1 Tax=Esox lucius TaxID=8010 RepID=UPI000576D63B|nr:uncharacterized protein LOC105020867 [Esox lucius]
MLVVCVAVIFSLVSVSQTAPSSQDCEKLLKPLDMETNDLLLGNWSLVAVSNNRPGARTLSEVLLINARWDIVRWEKSDVLKSTICVKYPDRTTGPRNNISLLISEKCLSYSFNMTLEDNKLSWMSGVPSTAIFLPTCPDCLLTQTTTSINGNTYISLELYSERRELTTDELSQFKTQVECLKMPPVYFINTTTELCPDYVGVEPQMNFTPNFFREILDFMERNIVKVSMRIIDFLIEKGEHQGLLRPGDVRASVLSLLELIRFFVFN